MTGNQRHVKKKRWTTKEVDVAVNCLIALTKYTTKAFKEGIADLGSQFKDIYHVAKAGQDYEAEGHSSQLTSSLALLQSTCL